jgi:predicted DNA-binding transcriptional regulator AlpA
MKKAIAVPASLIILDKGGFALSSDHISIKKVASELNVSVSTVRRLTNDDYFPQPYRIGGKTFFSKKEVLSWLDIQRSNRGFGNFRGTSVQDLREQNVNSTQ